MKIFLAGTGHEKMWTNKNFFDFYRLQTFYHISEMEAKNIHRYKDFLLDSGAFSFFGGKTVNWNDYVKEYINFINKYDVKNFFELDLYSIIGINETEKIRNRIEKETNKKTIPVFHSRLGIEYYKNLCKDYEYIAISASGKYESRWTRSNPNQLKSMLIYAKNKNIKVHGLGYTSLKGLQTMPFYSVDSTTWLNGRFGQIYVFNGNSFTKHIKPEGMRMKSRKISQHNFNEWIKFQKYAENNL